MTAALLQAKPCPLRHTVPLPHYDSPFVPLTDGYWMPNNNTFPDTRDRGRHSKVTWRQVCFGVQSMTGASISSGTAGAGGSASHHVIGPGVKAEEQLPPGKGRKGFPGNAGP